MHHSMLSSKLALLLASMCLASTALGAGFSLKDPKGDDNGPGTYEYPTDGVYTTGSFDITKVSAKERGKNVEFKVSIVAVIKDPWNSQSWNGNGFSVQFVQIYIDLDHKRGSGVTKALPGINLRFEPDSAWDKVVLVSPQPTGRVQAEIDAKAAELKDRIVIPTVTRAQGNSLVVLVPKDALDGGLKPGMGVQVVMQSNEGYPAATDLLTRKVNEYKGKHRFGGGNDYDCDPHALDILVPPAAGTAEESEKQHEVLKKYTCDEDETKWVQAVVPMIYPEVK